MRPTLDEGSRRLFKRQLCSFLTSTKFDFQNKFRVDGSDDDEFHISRATSRLLARSYCPSSMKLHEIFDEMIYKRTEARASYSMHMNAGLFDVILSSMNMNMNRDLSDALLK